MARRRGCHPISGSACANCLIVARSCRGTRRSCAWQRRGDEARTAQRVPETDGNRSTEAGRSGAARDDVREVQEAPDSRPHGARRTAGVGRARNPSSLEMHISNRASVTPPFIWYTLTAIAIPNIGWRFMSIKPIAPFLISPIAVVL